MRQESVIENDRPHPSSLIPHPSRSNPLSPGNTRPKTGSKPIWTTLKRQAWQWRGVLTAVPGVAGVVIGLRFTGLLQMLEMAMLDQFFLMRPVESIDSRIVIVEINESDVQKVGQWPMSDATLAQLITNIKQQKPSAIGLDICRDLPVNPGNSKLKRVFETTPNLIGVQKVAQGGDSYSVAPPPILKKLDQVLLNYRGQAQN